MVRGGVAPKAWEKGLEFMIPIILGLHAVVFGNCPFFWGYKLVWVFGRSRYACRVDACRIHGVPIKRLIASWSRQGNPPPDSGESNGTENGKCIKN